MFDTYSVAIYTEHGTEHIYTCMDCNKSLRSAVRCIQRLRCAQLCDDYKQKTEQNDEHILLSQANIITSFSNLL